jgi:hypothetical protein
VRRVLSAAAVARLLLHTSDGSGLHRTPVLGLPVRTANPLRSTCVGRDTPAPVLHCLE